ncbi:MAG: hypothetical protein WCO19_02090 [Candidatus Saccharibacteria bacterium]
MDPSTPNIQPKTPAPAPVTEIAAPVAPVAPVTPSQPLPSQPMPAAMATPVPGAVTASKSKKPFIFVGIAAAIILFIALTFLIILPAMSLLQAKSRADGFMKNMTSGDVSSALQYVKNGGDAEDKAFLTSAATSVKGSYSFKDSTKKDGKYYARFTLSGGKNVSARTELINEAGKWYLDGFFYSSKELALVPAAGEEKVTTTQKAETPATATGTPAASGACLTQDDYKYMSYDKQPYSVTFDSTYNPAKYTFNKIDDMFFEPDSLKESSFDSVYDDWAEFGTKMAAKQWQFRLEGSTYGSDAASVTSKKLASERAEKVKAALVKRGVSASKIVIDPPHDYGNEAQDEKFNKIYRRVQLVIDPTCTQTASSGNR